MCIYHEANGDRTNCPVQDLGGRVQHIRTRAGRETWKVFLLAYFAAETRYDVMAENISQALKGAA